MTPLEAAAACWVRDRRARGELAANSAEVELTRLRSLAAGFCDDVSKLDREVLLRWQRTIGGRAAGTRRQYLTTVSRFCRWLVETGRLEADPTVGLVRVREPRRVPRALSEEEVARVLEACEDDPRARAVVWLMVGCGLRCVEVSNLDLADYDPGRETLVVKGKAGHERSLPVDVPARRALERYLAGRGQAAGPLIRPDRRGKWSSDGRVSAHRISEIVSSIMSAAGVHRPGDGRTAHALRHTAASDVLDNGADVRLVSQMLGHQSLATTQVYLRRARLDQLRAAMAGRNYAAALDDPAPYLRLIPGGRTPDRSGDRPA